MRLNSAARLQQIILLGLSEPVFRAAKNLLAIGEKLKEAEQSLIFLKRCKLEQIFRTVLILNSIRASEKFFPLKFSAFHQKSLFDIRKSCLNQHTYSVQICTDQPTEERLNPTEELFT